MKFLVYTHHNGNTHEGATFREIGELTTPSKAAYAKRHGYDFVCRDQFDYTKIAPCFERIEMALEYLDSYDWMFYTDADAAIVNHDIRLEDLIDEKYDLITTRNAKNTQFLEINNGVMLIKCSEWSRALLNRINVPKYHRHEWFSQQALMDFYAEPETAARIKLTPWRFFNSLWHSAYGPDNWQPGDFVLHGCGASNAWRKILFTEVASKIASGQPFNIETAPCR